MRSKAISKSTMRLLIDNVDYQDYKDTNLIRTCRQRSLNSLIAVLAVQLGQKKSFSEPRVHFKCAISVHCMYI